MKYGKILLLATGLAAVLTGVIWIGQGSGYFPYPSYSFMINEKVWIWYGGVVALVGLVLVAIARRR